MEGISSHTMQAYADDEKRLHCMKCQRILEPQDVAMFIRSDPEDAFSTWCPGCTYDIVKLAAGNLADREGVIGIWF